MKRAWLGATLVAVGVLASAPAMAADHIDSTALTADPTSDITDLYTWMDGTSVALVLDVAPFAASTAKFSNTVQYVFHTASTDKFIGGVTPVAKDIICTFDAAQKISCWLGKDDYATGDSTSTAGVQSQKKTFTVFAGLRDDPFFFNFDGFNDAVATVKAAAASLQFDAAGCPTVDAATSAMLVNKLKTDPTSTPPGGVAKDFFAGKNVLSIVLKVDKAALTAGGPLMSVWASTNKGGS